MIVVTGAAGFIGSAYITYLNKISPHTNIIAVDKAFLDPIEAKNLYNLKIVNYFDYNKFLEILPRIVNYIDDNKSDEKLITSVIHFGAHSSTTSSNFELLLRNNFEYSKELCNYCQKNEIKFIYASSASTYGNSKRFYDCEHPITCSPISNYSFFKNLFDSWIFSNNIQNNCLGLKYFNVFGPNEYHKKDMISFILRTVRNKEKILVPIYTAEKGIQMERDFIYIKDAVKMTHHLVKNNLTGIYNIGTGISYTWNEVLFMISKSLNKTFAAKYEELPFKESYQYYTKADISKLLMTGYKEHIPLLEERIDEYIKKYLVDGKEINLDKDDDF